MPFNKEAALRVKRQYLCARCYSFLWSLEIRDILAYNATLEEHQTPIKVPPEDNEYNSVVYCPTHGDIEVVGRVTLWWAIMEGQKRAGRAMDLRYKIRTNDPSPEDFDPDQAVRDLGFD